VPVTPRIGTPPRRGRPSSLGAKFGEVAAVLGYELHGWQRHAAQVSLTLEARERAAGRSARRLRSSVVGVVVGRQSGKSAWAECRVWLQCLAPDLELGHLVGGSVADQHAGWLAQDRASALRQWDEAVERIAYSDYAPLIRRVRRQRGDEGVIFENGSTVRVVTPSRMGARGQSLDLVLTDEALAHPAELLAALAPTMAQRDGVAGSFGAQLVALSTAPIDETRSGMFVQLREMGRRAVADGETSTCWLEWSAEPGVDIYDPAVWRAACPTLDLAGGITSDFLAMQAELLDRETFAAEYLGIGSLGPGQSVVDLEAWAAAPAEPVATEGVVLGVDARPDGLGAAVVAASRSGPVVGLEVVEHAQGTGWLPGRVAELARRHGAPVVVDRNGPAGWLAAALEGVEVIRASTPDVIAAAALFVDAVSRGEVAHMRDPRLDASVEHAVRRRSGDRWAFDRAAADASPVVAASLAHWWALTAPAPAPPPAAPAVY